jgi:signal transduction histidine kinase
MHTVLFGSISLTHTLVLALVFGFVQPMGLVAMTVRWDGVLENIFADEVSGIDCILEIGGQAFTYSIKDGIPLYIGPEDLHDLSYTHFASSILLTEGSHFSPEAPVYKLTVYPTAEFFETFETHNPIIASIGAIVIILLTSFVFFVYDSVVRQKFVENSVILEAKRMFMRFVSHEVRTPLVRTT